MCGLSRITIVTKVLMTFAELIEHSGGITGASSPIPLIYRELIV